MAIWFHNVCKAVASHVMWVVSSKIKNNLYDFLTKLKSGIN